MENILRHIPKTDKLLKAKALEECNGVLLKKIVVEFLAIYRNDLLNGGAIMEFEKCVERIKEIYHKRTNKSLRTLVNATGIIVHTNLGRSVFSNEILEEVKPLLCAYNNLEYDLKEGDRSERYIHLKNLFAMLLGVEDVLVVNNNAAAVFLIFNTFAKNKEVVVSRGELIEIGGSFRIPRVMEDSGAILKEVGTTNKTYLKDYQEAINSNTAMLFKAHKSNYEIAGFSKEVDYQELIALAQEKGLLDYYDLGSGYFGLKGLDILKKYEMPLEEIASLNPSLVSFSGDKLLGGAQAGIIFGKKCYIDQLKQNQLLRMLRVDKFTLATLEATLMAYLQGKYEKIPTYKMLLQTKEVLKKKAEKLLELIQESFKPIILETKGYSGGGAMPNKALESFGIALSFSDEKKLEQLLRERGIIARVENGKVILDVMALLEGDEKIIQKALLDIKESYAR
ncbi:L-seryl-tRNA(Sec) selenium transferase [Helicobacter sp. 14348-15]|uniref:L-seryl-tRNA(Sec) selenium transferase n=1 Tax=Helicobacter colisuis TaxID=2949739 RepID=UPI00202ADE1A|nr:L-seryl-tRNA(Sec) selenium transferase [Helicobacter colisuis]MCL9821398.1 L-seryl-tRNA(Sec) selenium transferase [Helicobacter colisuis]